MNTGSIAIIGTYAPRQCGIATFTQDLRSAMLSARPHLDAGVAAIERDMEGHHPDEVRYVLDERDRAAYARLAEALNDAAPGAVSLQHEYGISADVMAPGFWTPCAD